MTRNGTTYSELSIPEITALLEQRIALQRVKVERSDERYFAGHVIKKLPIMMFLLLPLFALLLKLLYVRQKKLYIIHLIHALHLHSLHLIGKEKDPCPVVRNRGPFSASSQTC